MLKMPSVVFKIIRNAKEYQKKKAKKLGINKKFKIEDPEIPNHQPFKEHELKTLEAYCQRAIQEQDEKKAARKERINQFHPNLFEAFGGFLNCNNYLLLDFYFLYLSIAYVENLLIKLFHLGFGDS